MHEPNQAQEIYDCIKQNLKGVCIEDIVEATHWNRYLVEVATKIMVERNLIEKIGETEWGDPIYKARKPKIEDMEPEPDHSDITDEMGTR